MRMKFNLSVMISLLPDNERLCQFALAISILNSGGQALLAAVVSNAAAPAKKRSESWR